MCLCNRLYALFFFFFLKPQQWIVFYNFFFVTVLAIPTIIFLLSPPELLRTVFIFSNQISNFTQYPWSRWNFFPLFTFPHIICRCYPWRIKTYSYLLNFCFVNPLIWFSLLLNRGRLLYITLVRLYTCLFIFKEIPIVSFDFQYFSYPPKIFFAFYFIESCYNELHLSDCSYL